MEDIDRFFVGLALVFALAVMCIAPAYRSRLDVPVNKMPEPDTALDPWWSANLPLTRANDNKLPIVGCMPPCMLSS